MRPLVKSTPINSEMNKEFEDLIQPYMHDLRNYCTSLTKSTWDGDDLMQETLAKAYNDWLKKRKPIAKAYLFRIASNTRIDGYRKRKLMEVMNPDLSEFKQEEHALSDATFKVIEVMLRELTPKQQTAMLLSEAFGYTTKEISIMIDSSEGAVKAALHRARKKLKPITYDSSIFYLEEEKMFTYVTALRNGDPTSIVRLYQNEMIEPQMAGMRSQSSDSYSVVQLIASSGLTYILVTISMKNGRILSIPFYQVELAASLLQLEKLESYSSIAA